MADGAASSSREKRSRSFMTALGRPPSRLAAEEDDDDEEEEEEEEEEREYKAGGRDRFTFSSFSKSDRKWRMLLRVSALLPRAVGNPAGVALIWKVDRRGGRIAPL